jgi:hypothetical protein
MALKKQKEVKGIKADYWRIFRNDQNAVNNTTCVRLALYPSKEIRDKNLTNYLETEAFIFDGIDYTREDLYVKIKESKMGLVEPAIEAVEAIPAVTGTRTVVIKEAVEAKDAVLDEEGNVLEEAVEAQDAITEEQTYIIEPAIEAVEGKEAVYRETNWFVDAEDC